MLVELRTKSIKLSTRNFAARPESVSVYFATWDPPRVVSTIVRDDMDETFRMDHVDEGRVTFTYLVNVVKFGFIIASLAFSYRLA